MSEKTKKILKAIGTVLIAIGVAFGGSMLVTSCGPTWKLSTSKTTISDVHDSTTITYGTQK